MRYIIDVREAMEYRFGHVEGAVNLPLSSLSSKVGTVLSDAKKDDELIVYCQSGHRAGMALQELKMMGFTNVVNGVNADTVGQKYL